MKTTKNNCHFLLGIGKLPIFEVFSIHGNSQWNIIKVYIGNPTRRVGLGLAHLVQAGVLPSPWLTCSSSVPKLRPGPMGTILWFQVFLQRQRFTLTWKLLYEDAYLGDSLGQWVESEDGDSRRGDSRLVSPGKKFLELKGERLGGSLGDSLYRTQEDYSLFIF